MTTTESTEAYFDPYDVAFVNDPYPTCRRLRDEAPLYYNAQHDFFALSRFEDIERGLHNKETFISGRGAILELIKADIEIPPGVLIFEDPPIHTIHRALLSRMFTPKKVQSLEPQIRKFCAEALDPLVGEDGFDFIEHLGAQMPMKTISMLLGIPQEDQEAIRDRVDNNLRTEAGQPMQTHTEEVLSGEVFADYIDWRADHPSDDIMTDLLNVEFEDETGVTRKLTREEILTYVNVVAGAGNETTKNLIGWTGKVLGDHPGARRELAADPGLIPAAIEEILRYETPAPHVARYVSRDVELHGQTVPEGNVMIFLIAAANHDERKFPDPDTFDIHRNGSPSLTFGFGIHFCMGAALARLEGRVATEEVLKRFPDWTVDTDRAVLAPTSTVRGWETLPVRIP